MLRKLKARLAVISLVAIVLTLLTQSTLAYYTTVGTATNVVTSGNIRLMIRETTDQGTPFPKEGVFIMPGDVISKVVTVQNVCPHPFYLRVKLVYGVNAQDLPAEECLSLNIDETKWTFKDGWYYYNGILDPGAISEPVFSRVEIVGSKVDNDYLGLIFTLSITAQAVQSENNPLQNGDFTTAQGWPAEEEGGV